MESSFLNKKRLYEKNLKENEKEINNINNEKDDIDFIINSAFEDFLKGNNEQFKIKYEKLENNYNSFLNKI
jgi:hypothetical protein